MINRQGGISGIIDRGLAMRNSVRSPQDWQFWVWAHVRPDAGNQLPLRWVRGTRAVMGLAVFVLKRGLSQTGGFRNLV